MHCPTITNKAHFPPNSLFIEATAAIHGVYNKQNTSKQTAPNVEILLAIIAEEPINIERVDTILSLAKNPEINAVHIYQLILYLFSRYVYVLCFPVVLQLFSHISFEYTENAYLQWQLHDPDHVPLPFAK